MTHKAPISPNRHPIWRAGLLTAFLTLSTAIASPAIAATISMPELSPEQIARDVKTEYNRRTGEREYIAPSFDPFEQDSTMAGSASLRSVSVATSIDGQALSNGVMLDLGFYYNSGSNDPYDIRGFEEAAFLSGDYVPVVRRDNRVLECSSNVRETVYDHSRYYAPSLALSFYRPYRHYTGHYGYSGYGYGGFYRPSWRRGRGGHGWGRPSWRRRPHDDDGTSRRRRRPDDDGTDRRRRRPGTGTADDDGGTTRPRRRPSDGDGVDRPRRRPGGTGEDFVDVDRKHEMERGPIVYRKPPNLDEATGVMRRPKKKKPTGAVGRKSGSSKVVSRPRPNRVEPTKAVSKPQPSVSRPAPAPRPERSRRTETKRSAPVSRKSSRKSNRPVSRPRRDSKRLNFFPADYGYGGRDVVTSVNVDCAREETLSLFIPAERLDAARFDGMTVIVLDRQGQEYPVFVPPNYIEGFRRANRGISRSAPQHSYQSPPAYRAPAPITAPCPAGTTAQPNGTCLQTARGGYPR